MDEFGGGKHKILILDDESDIVDTLSMLVKKCGYKYRGVTNPLEAISIMDTEYFDLMLLDYKMSPINGDEVIKRVRGKGIDTYIILLTGYSDILPPIEALKNYDIQLYWEKSDDLGQIQLLIEAGIKALNLSRKNLKTMTGLENIIQSVPDIYKLRSIDIVLEKILEGIVSLTKIKHAFILADVDKPIYKGVGNYDNAIEDLAGKIDPFLMEQIGFARANKNMVINENSIILPLVNSKGVIFLEGSGFEENLELLQIFANTASSAFENNLLHRVISEQKAEIQSSKTKLEKSFIDTIEVLRLSVDARDTYTHNHSTRVANNSLIIGKYFDLEEKEMKKLECGGLFHDIGKIGIKDKILLKSDSLSNIEYEEIKKHPVIGSYILSAVSIFKDVVPIVRHHHERIDGRGYPDGIKGDEIPFLSRIISVVDAFDAMTSARKYRSKMNINHSIQQLEDGKDTQFDADVVKIFVKLLKEGLIKSDAK